MAASLDRRIPDRHSVVAIRTLRCSETIRSLSRASAICSSKKAEEYGSHPTTYEVAAAGTMRVLGSDGGVLMEH
eukprot:COSAG01_NODE_21861_length_881_cov_22.473146_1_plen_73_part_10